MKTSLRLLHFIVLFLFISFANLFAQELRLLPELNYAKESIGQSSKLRDEEIRSATDSSIESLKQKLKDSPKVYERMTSPHYGLSVYQAHRELEAYEILLEWTSKKSFSDASLAVEKIFPEFHPIAVVDLSAGKLSKPGDLEAIEVRRGEQSEIRYSALLALSGSIRSKPLEISEKVYDLKDLLAEIEAEPIQEPMPESEADALAWYERHKKDFKGSGKNPENDKALMRVLYGEFWKQVTQKGEKREDYYAIITGRPYLKANAYFHDGGRIAVLQDASGKFYVHHEVSVSASPKDALTRDSEEQGNRYIVFIRKDQLPVKLTDFSNSRRRLNVEIFFRF